MREADRAHKKEPLLTRFLDWYFDVDGYCLSGATPFWWTLFTGALLLSLVLGDILFW